MYAMCFEALNGRCMCTLLQRILKVIWPCARCFAAETLGFASVAFTPDSDQLRLLALVGFEGWIPYLVEQHSLDLVP